MKMIKYVPFWCFLIVSLLACNTNNSKASQSYDEVMLIHDSAMEQMGQLRSLSKQLSIQMDSTQLDTTLYAEHVHVRKELSDAGDHMMDWMQGFQKPVNDDEAAINYLKAEKVKIIKVSDDIFHAIDHAKTLLDANK